MHQEPQLPICIQVLLERTITPITHHQLCHQGPTSLTSPPSSFFNYPNPLVLLHVLDSWPVQRFKVSPISATSMRLRFDLSHVTALPPLPSTHTIAFVLR